jgi:hypothetical protein
MAMRRFSRKRTDTDDLLQSLGPVASKACDSEGIDEALDAIYSAICSRPQSARRRAARRVIGARGVLVATLHLSRYAASASPPRRMVLRLMRSVMKSSCLACTPA